MRKASILLAGLALCAVLAACKDKPKLDLPTPLTEAEKATLIASLPEPYHSADVANGKGKFAMCKSCHTIAPEGKNLTGPNLYGVFGRAAAARPDFDYSDAVKESGIVWNAEHLNGWLAGPRSFLKGTKMSFAGLKNENDRRDLIVYLMTETGYRTPEMKAAAGIAPDAQSAPAK